MDSDFSALSWHAHLYIKTFRRFHSSCSCRPFPPNELQMLCGPKSNYAIIRCASSNEASAAWLAKTQWSSSAFMCIQNAHASAIYRRILSGDSKTTQVEVKDSVTSMIMAATFEKRSAQVHSRSFVRKSQGVKYWQMGEPKSLLHAKTERDLDKYNRVPSFISFTQPQWRQGLALG